MTSFTCNICLINGFGGTLKAVQYLDVPISFIKAMEVTLSRPKFDFEFQRMIALPKMLRRHQMTKKQVVNYQIWQELAYRKVTSWIAVLPPTTIKTAK